MFEYFKIKKKEYKIKTMIYDTLLKFSDRKDKLFEVTDKLLLSVKGESPEEIKKEFMDNLIQYIYESKKDKDKE